MLRAPTWRIYHSMVGAKPAPNQQLLGAGRLDDRNQRWHLPISA
jgi:hypothetical protein